MAVRHPPGDNVPPVAVSGRRSRRSRLVRYEEPRPGFFRRWTRRIFRPPVVIALVFIATVTIGVCGYYWIVFSERIDRLLNGEVFTRSAGIYAAPKNLRVGESISVDELVAYLKNAGYVESTQQAETSRGRYKIEGTIVVIEPSQDGSVDGRRAFAPLRVQFAKGGHGVVSLTDSVKGTAYGSAQLEPQLISSVTGSDRSKRKVVGYNDLPPHLIKAIVTTEDRTFFEHYGVNFRGILRALIRRYDSDPSSPIAHQGGSSITQQLVKNLLLSPEKSIRRKVAEAYMSIILETRLSKEKIFELYCNQVYLGQQSGFSINGFGEASDAYFAKDVTTLTLPEAAFLAGIIRSPNRYNPYRDIETATSRRNQVLMSMEETGKITQLESAQAQATPLKVSAVKNRVDTSDAPYFTDYVQNQLADIILDQGTTQHLRIYTTVDMDLERAAYAAVTKQLAALDKLYAKRVAPGTLQAALVAMNPKTGEIIAMIGGRDYSQSQLNRATDAMRQPGSVFKPFVYATALNTAYDSSVRVITPATIYKDEPKTFLFDNQEYSPGNYGDQYSNAPVTVRDALVRSLNVVTVDIAMDVTIGRVMNLAAKAGLPKVQRAYPAMALGTSEATPLQVASAYTAFAANGTRTTPIGISRVTTGDGTTIVAPAGQKNEVVRPEVAYVLTDMLKDVVNRGTAARLGSRGFRNVEGKTAFAGKTGTSRDGWFAGYTPNIVCIAWVGFDDGSQLGLKGADSAMPIWADFMTAALEAHPEWNGDWQMPDGIRQEQIDTTTGKLATDETANKRTELFISGTGPVQESELAVDDMAAPETSESDDLNFSSPGDAVPDASPRSRTTPKLEGRGVPQVDGTTRLEGTITLDIDPTTGLIAAPTCPIIRSKTFVIGQEPRENCGPQYHDGSLPKPTPRQRSSSP